MANDVAGFMEEHNLSKPTLIGHSMCVPLPSLKSILTEAGAPKQP